VYIYDVRHKYIIPMVHAFGYFDALLINFKSLEHSRLYCL